MSDDKILNDTPKVYDVGMDGPDDLDTPLNFLSAEAEAELCRMIPTELRERFEPSFVVGFTRLRVIRDELYRLGIPWHRVMRTEIGVTCRDSLKLAQRLVANIKAEAAPRPPLYAALATHMVTVGLILSALVAQAGPAARPEAG